METMQRGVVVGEKTVYDMEAVYINITTVLECAVPPSIIDEFGILRKVKAQLMKNLVIVSTEPSNPDYVIVAAGQLFLPSPRAWEPDCSPTTHSRPQLCLTATHSCV